MTDLTTAKRIEFDRITHDFNAYFETEYIGSFPTKHQAENELNQHVLRLCENGLIDQPLAALAEQALSAALAADPPPADDDPESVNWSSRAAVPEGTDPNDFSDVGPEHCRNCGGAHHIQQCGEIWQALRAPALPATARQWLTEDWRRDAIAREWSRKLLVQADASAESYAGMEKAPV